MITLVPTSPGKVLLAMSGGVDSSVAAALLREAGHEVVGCFMRLGSPGQQLDVEACDPGSVKIGHQGCCSIHDAKDAELVAAKLGIPFYVLNFKKDFGRIIDYFIGEYDAGRTPNPCVRCNDWLKFGRLFDYSRSIDADYVASGHYARIERHDGQPVLLRGVDETKDQSYVLFGAPRQQLEHMLLPVGGFHKTQIRRLAEQFNLPVSSKPDSQEICFVPDQDYAAFIARSRPGALASGQIRDQEGRVLGEHAGHQTLTIGQRRGMGLALGHPIYVVAKDAATNTVTVGPKSSLACRALEADQANWLVDFSDPQQRCHVKIRYNARPVPAVVCRLEEGRFRVEFDQPQEAVAPGQAVVCYDGDRVLGGGWIATAEPAGPGSANCNPEKGQE